MSLKKTIRKILKEETELSKEFLTKIIERYPETETFIDYIKKEIERSGCKKIEFAHFSQGALGLALHNGVMISESVLSRELGFFLFVLFHELAHQHQFKKYGADIMYAFYKGELNGVEAAKFLKYTEIVADEFATRKCREFQKKGFIDKNFKPSQGFYKNVPENSLLSMLSTYRDKISLMNLKTNDEISEYFYNTIKKVL